MNCSRWMIIVDHMVATAQRLTCLRSATHRLLCSWIKSLGLGIAAESALCSAVSCDLFPKNADRLVLEGGKGA